MNDSKLVWQCILILFDYCGSVPWEKHKTIQARLKSPQPETINFRSYNLNTHLTSSSLAKFTDCGGNSSSSIGSSSPWLQGEIIFYR